MELRKPKAIDIVMDHANLGARNTKAKDQGETVWCYLEHSRDGLVRVSLSEALVYIQSGHRFDFNSHYIIVKGTR